MALASYAMDAAKSCGRRYPQPPHPYRNEYARDRDRVIHSRAFRRLEAKTQVFTTRYSDHFRNRLTHTLEVAQIARTVAGALQLNSDLAEALTFEVREGIVKHSRDYDAAQFPVLSEYLLDQRPPLEAQLIDFVDEIAYNTADLDDGYEAHVLDIEMIRAEVPLFARFYEEVERSHPQSLEKLKFNETAKRVLDHLATGLIQNTRAAVAASGVQSVEDVRHEPGRLAGFSGSMAAENAALKKFLLAHLYYHHAIVSDRERSVDALAHLFDFYVENPGAMSKAYAELAQCAPKHRVVCDYIAGMTDHYLLRQHAELLGKMSTRSV